MRTAMLVGLFACAGCGSGNQGTSADLGAPDLAPATEICKPDNQKVSLNAHYGVKVTINVNVKEPANCTSGDGSCIVDQDAVSQLLMLADVTQNGAVVTFVAHPCHFQIPTVSIKGQSQPTVLTAPDSLVQSIATAMTNASLDGPNTCASFALPPLALVVGARLASPGSDPLPVYKSGKMPPVTLCGGVPGNDCQTGADTGCICDQDKDGKPGATVTASGVPVLSEVDRIYLAIRTAVGLNATVFPPSATQLNPGQRFKGSVTGLKLEQSPIGCHQSPMGGPPASDCDDNAVGSIASLNPLVTQSQNKGSIFVAMPVPDGETCAQLLTDAPALFKNQ